MCYRYSMTSVNQIKEEYPSAIEEDHALFEEVEKYQPRFEANGFAHPKMPVISTENPGKVQLYEWGLIPPWVKTSKDAAKLQNNTLNARSETVFEKPAFRSSVKRKRCLVLTDGFYEWMHHGKEKYPHYIYLKDRKLFSFAGIWEEWLDKETGELRKTYSILTTEANGLMERIHNSKKRMPVILPKELEGKWLDESLEKEEVLEMTGPYPEEEMQAHTISKLITSRKEDSNVPEVQGEVEYPELGLLG